MADEVNPGGTDVVVDDRLTSLRIHLAETEMEHASGMLTALSAVFQSMYNSRDVDACNPYFKDMQLIFMEDGCVGFECALPNEFLHAFRTNVATSLSVEHFSITLEPMDTNAQNELTIMTLPPHYAKQLCDGILMTLDGEIHHPKRTWMASRMLADIRCDNCMETFGIRFNMAAHVPGAPRMPTRVRAMLCEAGLHVEIDDTPVAATPINYVYFDRNA